MTERDDTTREHRPRLVDRRRFVVSGIVSGVGSAAFAAASTLWPQSAFALEGDEGVVVLPSTARWLEDGRVELRVQAWVYEREGRRMATRALAKLLGLDLDEIAAADRERFAERTRLFAREAQARRRLRLHVPLHAGAGFGAGLDMGVDAGGRGPSAGAAAGEAGALSSIELPRSRRDGGIDAAVLLRPHVPPHVPTRPSPRVVTRTGGGVSRADSIDFELVSGTRRFPGRAFVHGREGLSVVSDIDDTIKHTQVRDRRQMLRNTFARPFTAVPGMAAWYERISRAALAADGRAVAFHYVSSGPWALAGALEGFMGEHAFAAGSLHLRAFSLAPHALMDKGASSAHKHATIERLLADQPQRRFVFIGDSGEHDPEIYGAVARRHPTRVAAILVRDVTGEAAAALRYRAAFGGVARERWSIFDDPAQLPDRWV